MNKCLFILSFIIPSLSFGQLDLKSISFEQLKEIPGEKYFNDTTEFEFINKVFTRKNESDSLVFSSITCAFELSNDTTSDYKDYSNYTIAKDIHIGDFNSDKKNDCIFGFSIWGCYTYVCRAYLSKGDQYYFYEFPTGALTKVVFKNNQLTEVQNKIYESCMYGFNTLRSSGIQNGNPYINFELQYLYDSDSLLQTIKEIKNVVTKKDSLTIYGRESICNMGKGENDWKMNVALKSKKIQQLISENEWILVIIEVKDTDQYQIGELIPQKKYISAWMKKADL